MSIIKIIFSGCVLVLLSCSNTVDLNYKLQTGVKYNIQQEENVIINKIETDLYREFEMEVEDLSDIKVVVLQSETTTNNEDVKRITKKFKEDYSQVDTTKTGPNFCKSTDSKIVRSDNKRNQNTNLDTGYALDSWNSQEDFPNTKMKVGETITKEISVGDGSSSLIREYTLEKIENNIAYLSYEESTQYKSELLNIQRNQAGNTTRVGKLEYDITNDFYRLFYLKNEFSHTPVKNQKSKRDQKLRVYRESSTRINMMN